MREIIGQTAIQTVLTEGHQERDAARRTPKAARTAGMNREQVVERHGKSSYSAVDPPADVIDAFNDVQRARQDRDRLKNRSGSVPQRYRSRGAW